MSGFINYMFLDLVPEVSVSPRNHQALDWPVLAVGLWHIAREGALMLVIGHVMTVSCFPVWVKQVKFD